MGSRCRRLRAAAQDVTAQDLVWTKRHLIRTSMPRGPEASEDCIAKFALWTGKVAMRQERSHSRGSRNISRGLALTLVFQRQSLQHCLGSFFEAFGLAGPLLPSQ